MERLAAFAIAFGMWAAPCGTASLAGEPTISPVTMERHIRRLASREMRGRSGSESRVAGDYIRAHFESLRLSPLFDDGFFQSIPGHTRDDGTTEVAGRNVGAFLRGSDPELRDEYVIISAHYDHLGVRNGVVFPGADDNASGVAMLLEAARVLAEAPTPPRRSIAFVGFDLEEKMLWGSRWFAAHPPWPLERLKLFMTADMIGRSLGDLPLPMVFVLGSEHSPQVRQTLEEIDPPDGLEVARLGTDIIGTRSDYGPFRDRQIPFLFFSTGEHPDYHSPRDVPDRVDFAKAARISQLLLEVCTHIADSDDAPEWTSDMETDIAEAQALNRIAELLEEAEANDEREFNDIQRMLVTHVRSRTASLIEKNKMSLGDRKWLIRVSQMLMFSVF